MTSPLHIAILTRLSDGPADVAQLARDCGGADISTVRKALHELAAHRCVRLRREHKTLRGPFGKSCRRRVIVARLHEDASEFCAAGKEGASE